MKRQVGSPGNAQEAMKLTDCDPNHSLQSQKLGGRSLIGSDFEDPSSSPHEPLRTALSRTEHAPLIEFGSAVAAPAPAPSTPLTNMASSK
jgi:hypothetical protein